MQTALSLSLEAESARPSVAESGATNRLTSSNTHPLGSSTTGTNGIAHAGRGGARASPGIRVRFDARHVGTGTDSQAKPAILGNHLAIQRFLQQQLHEPSRFDFAAIVNRPGYEAAQRLIMQHGPKREMLGHVHVQPSTMQFGSVDIPLAQLRHFAMYPEYRLQGYDSGLLQAAEKEAKRQGAMLCVSRGGDRDLFRRHGWVSVGYDPISIVSPRRLIAQLPKPVFPESPFYGRQGPEYYVRIGRLTDLDAMQSLYRTHWASQPGVAVRDDAYWSWLVTRGAHHRIYFYFEDDAPRAYVVVRHASVLELVDSTADGRGAARLLEQVGADAIEQGRYSIRIHAPIDDRVHLWSDQADGRLYVGEAEEAWLVKVTSYRALLRRLAPEMFRRQRKQNVVDAVSIRIGGSEEIRIARGVRSMKVTRGIEPRHRIGLTQKAAVQLLLGYQSADQLADTQQLVASSDEAMRTIRILLPALNLWRTEWDDTPVIR